MIALLSAGGAFRDVFLALGVGLIVALFYSAIKALLGTKRVYAAICDVATFIFAAVLFRSAAVGMFEGGIMRWYTAVSAVFSYMLFTHFALHAVLNTSNAAKVRVNSFFSYIKKPLYTFSAKFISPFFGAFYVKTKKFFGKMKKIRPKRAKSTKTHLQNTGNVLYNS